MCGVGHMEMVDNSLTSAHASQGLDSHHPSCTQNSLTLYFQNTPSVLLCLSNNPILVNTNQQKRTVLLLDPQYRSPLTPTIPQPIPNPTVPKPNRILPIPQRARRSRQPRKGHSRSMGAQRGWGAWRASSR